MPIERNSENADRTSKIWPNYILKNVDCLKFSAVFKKYVFVHKNKLFLLQIDFSDILNCDNFSLAPSITTAYYKKCTAPLCQALISLATI